MTREEAECALRSSERGRSAVHCGTPRPRRQRCCGIARGAHADAMAAGGLILRDVQGERRAKVRLARTAAEAGPVSAIVVTTKGHRAVRGLIACLTGLHNGEIRTDPNLNAILDRLSAEGVALARAHGCDPPAKIVIPAAGPIAGHKQSMPQDLERGRPVEYQPIASPLPRLRICCCASLHWGGSVRRRNFIAIAGGAAAWPFMVRAQPSNVPVIGYLGSSSILSCSQVVYALSWKGCARPATMKAATWPSNIAGQRVTTTDCQR